MSTFLRYLILKIYIFYTISNFLSTAASQKMMVFKFYNTILINIYTTIIILCQRPRMHFYQIKIAICDNDCHFQKSVSVGIKTRHFTVDPDDALRFDVGWREWRTQRILKKNKTPKSVGDSSNGRAVNLCQDV